MSYEFIALTMFASMMVMLLTGQRVFAAIGFVAAASALLLWGDGGSEIAFSAAIKLMKWYPLLTLPLFIYMGYVLSESGIADDLYRMFHVWMGPLRGGLAIGTIGLMVAISAMNGLSVAGMAIGASIALPELLRRGYDKIMVTGVIQAGSSLGILVPPSVVLVLYGMIARQPVGQLWLAGVVPGLMMAGLFVLYIVVRCKLQPHLGPALPAEERDIGWAEKLRLLRAGILPLVIFFCMTGLFVMGVTSLVESSAVGATAATLAALVRRRLTWHLMEVVSRKTLAISCMFMWIIMAALCFGAVFDGLGAVRAIEGFFVDRLGLGPWEILIMMQLSYLVMGMFLDDTAMLVIVAPLYVPLVGSLGFDLIWYGVLYTITCQIAYMTPPFGYNLFLMRAMAPPEISLTDIYRSIIPFVLVMIVGLALVTAFPQIAMWLPDMVYDRVMPGSSTAFAMGRERDTMKNRRDFLKKTAVAGVAAGAAATIGAPYVHAQSKKTIKWRVQTYAGPALAEHVIKPSVDAFNKAANGEMEIELYFADQLVPTGELFRAMQRGTIDAVQSDDDSIAAPVDISVFGGYFPFATRFSLDVPVLFNQWGLKEIWEEAYGEIENVTWLSAGAWDPCHFNTVEPIRSLDDLKGKRVFTFPTAGKFLQRFGVVPVTLPWEDIEVAVQTGELDGIAWSGITEDYTVGWADVTNYFLTNNISGAWCGSYFANTEKWEALPEHLKTLFRLSMDSSHYYRQYWYWGGEANLRVNGKKLQLTTIPEEEWKQVEDAAVEFWDEIAAQSPRNAKVVGILRKYNELMRKAGPPYRA